MKRYALICECLLLRLWFGCNELRSNAQVTDGVYVAIGYDLANTILIQTTEGHVVVDVSMNPVIAERVRADLEAEVGKAPIHTIIYTHSHVVSETMWQDY